MENSRILMEEMRYEHMGGVCDPVRANDGRAVVGGDGDEVSEIKVGDRVQWQRHGHAKGTFVTGIVTEIKPTSDDTFAVVKSDLGGWCFPALHKLTRITKVEEQS